MTHGQSDPGPCPECAKERNFDAELKVHATVAKKETDDDLMKKYLEQTQVEVEQELAIVRLEKELVKARSALQETRLTKTNLMNKLKGLPEADPEMTRKLRELLQPMPSPSPFHPYFKIGSET
jgi:hypothetical protein